MLYYILLTGINIKFHRFVLCSGKLLSPPPTHSLPFPSLLSRPPLFLQIQSNLTAVYLPLSTFLPYYFPLCHISSLFPANLHDLILYFNFSFSFSNFNLIIEPKYANFESVFSDINFLLPRLNDVLDERRLVYTDQRPKIVYM